MRSLTESIQRMLIEPSSYILDIELRHKSRLLNILLLSMIVVFMGVDGVYLATTPGYMPPWYGYVFLLTAYLLNRNHFYHFAAFMVLAMFPVVIFASIITQDATDPVLNLYYLVPGLILCGILLSMRATIFFALIEIAVILTMPFVVPDFFLEIYSVVGPASILMITAALVLVSVWFRDRIERDRQEVLGRAEQKYRTIFDNAIDGIFQSTLDGRFINVNPAMARMYGFDSPEDMIGSITDISSQLYVNSDMRKTLRQLLEQGKKITGFESLDYRKDGSTFWTSMNIQAILDPDGKIQYYEGTVEDITSRKMADEILRESEERYHTLFNRILDGVYRSSHDGRFLDVNPAIVRMFGYDSREEMLSIDIKKKLYFAPEERESLFLDTGQEKVDEFRMRRKDGSEIWVEDHGHYVHDQNGNVIYHEGILRDVTERKYAEMAFQKTQQRLQAFFNQSLDGFFFSMLDEPCEWESAVDREKTLNDIFANQRFTDVNNALLDQYGITREKFLSLTSSDVFAHDPQQGLDLRRDLFDQGHLHTETYERRADGIPVWFEGEYVCLYDEQKRITGFFGIQRDISERKRTENERDQLIYELAAKNAESETLRESFATLAGTLEFSEIIQYILDHIRRVIPYDSASVWRLEGDKQKFIGGRGLPSIFLNSDFEFISDETNSALPILRGETPYILNNNVQEELKDFQQEPHTYVNSWLAIPLKTRGKIIGVIALDGREKGQFNEHHAELAVAFANQVVVALENAQLFSDLQNELQQRKSLIEELEKRNAESETLRETTVIVTSTLDISEAVERILKQLKRVIGYDSASVWLYSGNVARMVGGDGVPDLTEEDKSYTVDETEPDYPLWTRELPYVLIDDIQANYPNFREPPINYIHGWLSIPLNVHGKLSGFISLDGKRIGQFTHRNAQLALNYANQVSIALENARLFSDLQNELGERKKLISELENKNEELERFTYTVSHDLKSPLVTINGFLGYLEQDASSGNMERFRKDTSRIQDAVNKMQRLLSELLELSRIGRMMNTSEAFSFDELVSDALDITHGRLEEHRVTVEVLSRPNPTTINGDRQRLLEVLQNLLDNAAKYMGDQPNPRIEIGQQGEEDDRLVFFVRDNGMGINPQYHDRIFGLFNKLDPHSEGTGVGLALIKRIIEVHGGRIWVESQVGKGSTFFFTLARGD